MYKKVSLCQNLSTFSAQDFRQLTQFLVPPKVKGTRGRREVIKPLSGLDVDSLLSREKREKISPDNTIPEFKQMLASPPDDNVIYDAARQIADIIRMHISHSTGDSKYEEVMADMKVFREYMVDFEMPDIWNDFIRDFKKRAGKGELGGDRREFWQSLRGANLGLIDKKALEISDVTEKEANEVRKRLMTLLNALITEASFTC
jgi:ATP-dependent DNA helicase 2 subunit 2